jgi:hypothetical protein
MLTAGLAVQIVAFRVAQAWANTQAHGGGKLGAAGPATVSITAGAAHTRA